MKNDPLFKVVSLVILAALVLALVSPTPAAPAVDSTRVVASR
ncbi:MAG TPA: hypothetical protein VHE61_10815 [Opitutaceae bacterium]|nr:hypothetical protein [Opitutaceae bacterium]